MNNKKEVLLEYLKEYYYEPNITEDDVTRVNDDIYKYDGNRITILDENESYEYLIDSEQSLIEYDKIQLKEAGFGRFIDFIDFEKYYEDEEIENYDFTEFNYEGEIYYINIE